MFKFSVFLLLLCQSSYSQIRGTVINSVTGKPVPYAVLLVENTHYGIASNLDATFYLAKRDLGNKVLIATGVGYKKTEVLINNGSLLIELVPERENLPEVQITHAITERKRISDPDLAGYSATFPWILARFFPYLEEYGKTPFIKSIMYSTYCGLRSGKYRIRFFGVDGQGQPAHDLLFDQLIFESKPYQNEITVDLRKYKIRIPADGFFIGFEWLPTTDPVTRCQKIVFNARKIKNKVCTYFLVTLYNNLKQDES